MIGPRCGIQDKQRGSPERKARVDLAIFPPKQMEMRCTMPTLRTLRLVIQFGKKITKTAAMNFSFYYLRLASSNLAEKVDLTRKALEMNTEDKPVNTTRYRSG